MVSSGAFLQSNTIYHGDMRPVNIMMNNEGKLSLTDHGLLNPYKDNYNKALAGKKDVYLTPVNLEHLRNKNKNPAYDGNKADVFSLGMTLIHAANLESPISAYDWGKKNISKAELDSHLQMVQNNYSPRFNQLVRAMVEFDDEIRPDFLQLNSKLNMGGPSVVPPPMSGFQNQSQMMGSQMQNSQAFNPYKSAMNQRSMVNPYSSRVGNF